MMHSSPKILITGGNGQIATALLQHAKQHQIATIACPKEILDITSFASIQKTIAMHNPDIVVNTAAFTAVDEAEIKRTQAFAINVTGAENLSRVCQQNDLGLIHLSTDYVFAGDQLLAYDENAQARPVNFYGQTKLLAEEVIQAHCKHYLILRISGVFSCYGHNFMKTIFKLLKEKQALHVVADQITCPTSANDIANTILEISSRPIHSGIYHYCSAEPSSWFDFACAILTETQKYLSSETIIRPKLAKDEPPPAKRPAYSVLNCQKIWRDFGIHQPSWQTALQHYIPQMI